MVRLLVFVELFISFMVFVLNGISIRRDVHEITSSGGRMTSVVLLLIFCPPLHGVSSLKGYIPGDVLFSVPLNLIIV